MFLLAFSISLNLKSPQKSSFAPAAHAFSFPDLPDIGQFGDIPGISDIWGTISDYYGQAKDTVDDWLNLGQDDNSTDNNSKPKTSIDLIFDKTVSQEKQKVNIKLVGQKEDATDTAILIAKPNVIFPADGTEAICRYIKNTPNNKIIYKQFGSCSDGKCEDNYDFTIPDSTLTKNYKIQAIGLFASEPIEDDCTADSIIAVTTQDISVEGKQPADTSIDTDEYGAMKGKIRINSPTSINKGDAVAINVKFTSHKNDQFMLWITDCDGTFVPKISSTDQLTRTILNDDFTYHYTWDTQAAQTKSCKHTVQVKTFAKNSTGSWLWNDMSKYEITVGANPSIQQVCIMQLENTKVQNGNQKISVTNQKITVNSDTVKLTWNTICGATYYIFRDGELLGSTNLTNYTDEEPPSGEVQYRIDAYIKGSPEEVMRDRNISFNPPIGNFLSNFIHKAHAAGPVVSKVITIKIVAPGSGGTKIIPGTSTSCHATQTRLGVPIPIRSGAGFQLIHCVDSMKQYLGYLYNFLIIIAELSAVLMIIWGGYMYMASGGEPAKTTAAREIIMGAIIGLVLLLSARLIISTIGFSLKDSQNHFALLQDYLRHVIT